MKKIKVEKFACDAADDRVVALSVTVPSPIGSHQQDEELSEGEFGDLEDEEKSFEVAENLTKSPMQQTQPEAQVYEGVELRCETGSQEVRAGVESPLIRHLGSGSPVQLTSEISDSQQHQSVSTTQQQANPKQQQQQQQQQTLTAQQFLSIQRSLPPGSPANYCNICKKELCNKYFMKTHMQKMHGINLDNCNGGVVCDICQKELCSKYFLKVHKSNTHGITDFTSGAPGSRAANAATAVAVALTNYSLNSAQKRAALDLAFNPNQGNQAAALMNAAAASAAFSPLRMAQAAEAVAAQRREQLSASSLIDQLKQHQQQQQQQQQQSSNDHLHNLHNQQQHQQYHPGLHQNPHLQFQEQHHQQQQQQPTDLRNPQAHLISPQTNSSVPSTGASNLHVAFPAALLAAQLAAQQQQQQQTMISHSGHHNSSTNNNNFTKNSNNQPASQFQNPQPQPQHQPQRLVQPQQSSPLFFASSHDDPLDSEDEDTCDRETSSNLDPNGSSTNLNNIDSGGPTLNAVANATSAGSAQLSSNQNINTNHGNNSSSRYLRHYTEACPFCDRRFKSIKWLQSHVMNDHKNIVSNQLVNLVLQLLLYNSNSNSGANSAAASGQQ